MNVHIQKDAASLSQELADWLAADMKRVIGLHHRYTLVLSGGSTPKKLYELLATEPYKSVIDWQKVHLFWGDERYVPFADERNNGRMAYDTLIKYLDIPEKQIHYMNTTMAPDASAKEYETILHQYFDDRPATFDLVLLGMGDDGHTLSLFPGSRVIEERDAWVVSPYVEDQQMYRITLTAPVVNKSSAVAFMVTGEKKSETLREVMKGQYRPEVYPSQVIKPENGNLHWFVDEKAAALLP